MSTYDIGRMYPQESALITPLAAAKTDEPLATAKPGRRITVDHIQFSADGICTFKLNSKGASAGTQISPTYYVGANAGVGMDLCKIQTKKGEGLSFTTTIATTANYSGYVLFHYSPESL